MLLIFIITLSLTITGYCALRKRYDGYQLFEVIPEYKSQLAILQQFHGGDGILFSEELPLQLNRRYDILVAPNKIASLRNSFNSTEVKSVVKHLDFQRYLDTEWERLDAKIQFDLGDFNTFDEIQRELQRLVLRCPEGFDCEVQNIGHSVEGREINMFKVTQHRLNKKVVWLDSLIHAREWIAGTSVMLVLHHLIVEYSTEKSARNLLDTYDFYVLPVCNPDGYVYSWESERMWRKNRAVNSNSPCMGVDLNRNHKFGWGELPGASKQPCSDTYMGPSRASEPEVVAVEAAMMHVARTRRLCMTLCVHTSAEAWLLPYGFHTDERCTRTRDHGDMKRVADAAGAAIVSAGGKQWRVGTSCELLYANSGSVGDFAYGMAGVKYAYTPELRGPGFAPDPSVIAPAFKEFYDGVVAALSEMETVESTKSRANSLHKT